MKEDVVYMNILHVLEILLVILLVKWDKRYHLKDLSNMCICVCVYMF